MDFDPLLDELVKAVSIAEIRPYQFTAGQREANIGNNWRGNTSAHFVDRNIATDQFFCHFHGTLWEGTTEPVESPVWFQLDLGLLYVVPDVGRWTDDQLKAYAQTSTDLQAWPYWREFVQSSAARLAVEVPVVGVAPISSRPATKS